MFDMINYKFGSKIVYFYLLFSFLFLLILLTPVGDYLESRIGLLVSHKIRDGIEKDPIVHSKLKFVMFEDSSLRALSFQNDLSLEHWYALLKWLDEQKVDKVFLDRLFLSLSKDSPFYPQLEFFMKNKKTKIYLGSTFMEMKREGFSYVLSSPWKLNLSSKGYAFSSPAYELFDGIGILNFKNEWYGKIKAFYGLDSGYGLPQFGLLSAKNLEVSSFSEGGFISSDENKPIPYEDEFFIYPKFINMNKLMKIRENKQFLTFYEVILSLNKNEKIFNEGDVVIFSMGNYTGGTDFVETPVGTIPGALVHFSIINSVLNDSWISVLNYKSFFIFFMSFVTFMGVVFWKPLWGFCWIFILVFMVSFLGIFLFIYFDLLLNWVQISLGMLVTGSLHAFGKARLLEQKAQRITYALEGLVSPKLLERLRLDSNSLEFHATSIHVSVMFIDIIDFSSSTESMPSHHVFSILKDELKLIMDVIHSYGGIIDKTLGDGLLCFFGYSYGNTNDEPREHALLALRCAKQIQEESAQRIIQRRKENSDSVIFPLRIGINSGIVFLGNLGTKNRFDLTIVGNVVNYAKRYEEACESFRVLIGDFTAKLFTEDDITEFGLLRRYLVPKHHTELWQAWEFVPLRENLKMELSRAVRLNGIQKRAMERFEVSSFHPVKVRLGKQYQFQGMLLDFSQNGLSIESEIFLTRKVELPLILDNEDGSLKKKLEEHQLLPLLVSVRWGNPKGRFFLLGLQIHSLNESQQKKLLDILKQVSLGE